ncbi:MAG: hypothetical protein ACUVWR_18825 [Anaerolineae bacterium]
MPLSPTLCRRGCAQIAGSWLPWPVRAMRQGSWLRWAAWPIRTSSSRIEGTQADAVAQVNGEELVGLAPLAYCLHGNAEERGDFATGRGAAGSL